MSPILRDRRLARWLPLGGVLALLIAACVAHNPESVQRHLWWSGVGPVLPHDTFPGDCTLCHVGSDWQTLTKDFQFDHAAETGYALTGAHARAICLGCHNDRGPVQTFALRGCVGCHQDVHYGQLGNDCSECHRDETWEAFGQIELHYNTRFPLVGAHLVTACWRCHPGAEVGKFLPTATECVVCHRTDLQNTANPDHIALGWVDRCNRCHLPLTWQEAEIHQ